MVESRRVKILSKKPHGSFLLANIHRQSFNDVLLLCSGGPSGDKTFISTHRMILSSISPLLSSLLKEYGSNQEHPIVISLPGTDPKVMNFLLDFAYSGKTTVPLEHLDGISETSKRLRIKYLENAIVKVERAPTDSVAILKPIKPPPSKGTPLKKVEIKTTSKGSTPSSAYESSAPVFQPRKRTTKIRKVLIPKCNKGSSTSDLPVVDLEECKSEIIIKNDGSHVQVLRHLASGLVLQPVSQIPTHKKESLRSSKTENELTPQLTVGGLAAVSKGFTITSPTVGVGYQGSRVLVQKSRSITLNHDGEEIIHCDKEMKVGEYEADMNSHEEEEELLVEQETNKEVVDLGDSFEEIKEEEVDEDKEMVSEDMIQSEEIHEDFDASDIEVEEKVVSTLDEEASSQLSEEEDIIQERSEMDEEDDILEEVLNEDEIVKDDDDSDEYGEEEEKATHCRTSGRVRKMNPKYFHDDNISAAEAKTPPKEQYHRKRSRTSSENISIPLLKKKK